MYTGPYQPEYTWPHSPQHYDAEEPAGIHRQETAQVLYQPIYTVPKSWSPNALESSTDLKVSSTPDAEVEPQHQFQPTAGMFDSKRKVNEVYQASSVDHSPSRDRREKVPWYTPSDGELDSPFATASSRSSVGSVASSNGATTGYAPPYTVPSEYNQSSDAPEARKKDWPDGSNGTNISFADSQLDLAAPPPGVAPADGVKHTGAGGDSMAPLGTAADPFGATAPATDGLGPLAGGKAQLGGPDTDSLGVPPQGADGGVPGSESMGGMGLGVGSGAGAEIGCREDW